MMFLLDGFVGKKINLDLHDGDLCAALSLLADAARQDGCLIYFDKGLKGKICVAMNEPWNFILVEILSGVNFKTTVVDNTLIISHLG